MNGKIVFGVDYLHALLEMNMRSKEESSNASVVAKVLLVLEWGFTPDEVDQANKEFWGRVEAKKLDNFGVAVTRLTSHLKDNEDSKTKFLVDLIVITNLDGNLSDEERALVYSLAEDFDLRKSEILKIVDRAIHVSQALDFLANSYDKE